MQGLQGTYQGTSWIALGWPGLGRVWTKAVLYHGFGFSGGIGWNRLELGKCYYREYAMGWGLAQDQAAAPLTGIDYVQDPPANFSSQDFWRWVQQSTEWNIFSGSGNPLATSYAVAGAARWPSSGLPAYHEIPLGNLAQPLRFAIALRQSADALPTTDAASRISAPRGWFAYAGLAQGQALRVVSAAETYFSRPQARSDGRRELASLFRPYWQARRTALRPDELAQARSAS